MEIRSARQLDGVIQSIAQQFAIGQVSQCIVKGHVVDAVAGLFVVGDVLDT